MIIIIIIISVNQNKTFEKKSFEIIPIMTSCYPKIRDTCIFVDIQAPFDLTMQCGHIERKLFMLL